MDQHNEAIESITIRILKANDKKVLDRVLPDVFDFEIDDKYRAEFLADSRHHLAVALAGDWVVGMASALHYVHPDKPNELWINEVGVAPAYQRRGIGKQLLEKLFDLARELGCTEAWVLTEEENSAARGLYAAVGGSEESVVYVTFELASTEST
ncbi:MAG: GNAT family N-acetyltransferase [Cyanobacteriota bacterium]|nr:GNAT family N-acetyltransferase [Cyanobacteriota bacterium]